MEKSSIDTLDYLEQRKSEIIFKLTAEVGCSEEKAAEMFNFLTGLVKALKKMHPVKSLNDEYVENAFRNFPF